MAMLRIDRSANGEVRFTLIGRIGAAHVAELQRLIDAESAGNRPIVLDGDVKLVASSITVPHTSASGSADG